MRDIHVKYGCSGGTIPQTLVFKLNINVSNLAKKVTFPISDESLALKTSLKKCSKIFWWGRVGTSRRDHFFFFFFRFQKGRLKKNKVGMWGD